MQEALISTIQREYRLRVREYRSHKKAWVLTTDRGNFFFKAFVFHDGPRLLFIDHAMHHLIDRGFLHIIPFEKTQKGLPYISYAKKIFFMTPLISCRQANYDQTSELIKAAELLAQLHLASQGFRPSKKLNPQLFWGLWPQRFREKIQHLYTFRAQLDSKTRWDLFDQLYAEKFPYYFCQAQQALAKIRNSEYQRLNYNEQFLHPFCHHDYEYHNLLINSAGYYYIIDFDYLLCDTHLHDLASLLIRAGRRSNWAAKSQELVLESYHRYYPIKKAEIPVLQAILLFPQDFWQVAYARYFENQPWPLKRFLRIIQRCGPQELCRLNYIQNLAVPN